MFGAAALASDGEHFRLCTGESGTWLIIMLIKCWILHQITHEPKVAHMLAGFLPCITELVILVGNLCLKSILFIYFLVRFGPRLTNQLIPPLNL